MSYFPCLYDLFAYWFHYNEICKDIQFTPIIGWHFSVCLNKLRAQSSESDRFHRYRRSVSDFTIGGIGRRRSVARTRIADVGRSVS